MIFWKKVSEIQKKKFKIKKFLTPNLKLKLKIKQKNFLEKK
jgi:hypothetical protein